MGLASPRLHRFRHLVFSESLPGARRIANFAPSVRESALREPRTTASPEDDAFLLWVLERGGLDTTSYRIETLRRRLTSILRALHSPSSAEARHSLERDPSLLPAALSSAIIGVTAFFRDPVVFELLQRRVLPQLASSRGPRVWSVGCSEGAELYSIAMLLAKLGRLDEAELVGTDCRSEAIAAARQGFFEGLALKEVAREDRSRFFEEGPPRWRVVDELRRATTWRIGDALTETEPGPWDLILCRNLAIYLNDDAIRVLWRRLTAALRPGGYLIAGKAERPSAGRSMTMIGPCVYRYESL